MRYHWLRKIFLLKCLNWYILGHPGALNVLTCPKIGQIWTKAILPNYFFLWVKLNLKLSLLVKSELLGHFVNTLAADDKYYWYKTETFTQEIQMQLSKQPIIFYQFLIAFLEYTPNFQHLEKKDEAHSSTLSNIIDSDRSCYLNVLKAMF